MSGEHFIPRKDNDFLRWTFSFISYLAPRAEQFNFPEKVSDSIQTQFSDFGEKLRLADEPATRTKLTIEAKTEARKLLEKTVRTAVKEYLTYNHLVSNEDRDGLGIPIHKTTRTPSPVAKTFPDFDVDSGTLRRLTIDFYDAGNKKSKAKPAGQHGAEMCWTISDVPVIDISELNHSVFDTHTPLTLEFQGHERGQTVYFALRWENTRGEKGPWSAIQSAIIP
jgi:hypothetical protein